MTTPANPIVRATQLRHAASFLRGCRGTEPVEYFTDHSQNLEDAADLIRDLVQEVRDLRARDKWQGMLITEAHTLLNDGASLATNDNPEKVLRDLTLLERIKEVLEGWEHQCELTDAALAHREALAACVQELETDKLNHATKLIDEERRRWYRALEAVGFNNLEGLAPEMVATQAKAEVQELEREVAAYRSQAIGHVPADRSEPIRVELSKVLDSLYGLHYRPGHLDAVLKVVEREVAELRERRPFEGTFLDPGPFPQLK